MQDILAQEQGIMVLPFAVAGSNIAINKLSARLPVDLQVASHFILEQELAYPLFSLAQTNSLLSKLNITTKSTLTSTMEQRLCRQSKASYLIHGSCRINAEEQIWLKVRRISCRTGQVLTVPRSKLERKFNTRLRLQKQLRKLLLTVGSFAKPRLSNRPVLAKPKPLDIALLLDLSGSMRYDVTEILEQLGRMRGNLSDDTRLGAVVMEGNSKQTVLKMTSNWLPKLKRLKSKPVKGEVHWKDLQAALQIVERYDNWKWGSKAKLLLLTDVAVSGKTLSQLLSPLRRLQARGVEGCIFPLLGQTGETRAAWERLAHLTGFRYQKDLVYGRKMVLARGGTLSLLQKANRFFTTKGDVATLLQNERLEWTKLFPLTTVAYSSEQLNLFALPQAFAFHNRDKVLYLSDYTSNLGKTLVSCLADSNSRFYAAKHPLTSCVSKKCQQSLLD